MPKGTSAPGNVLIEPTLEPPTPVPIIGSTRAAGVADLGVIGAFGVAPAAGPAELLDPVGNWPPQLATASVTLAVTMTASQSVRAQGRLRSRVVRCTAAL